MRKYNARWQWLIGCVVLLFMAAGCFQQAAEGDTASLQQPLPTNTPPPTNTPMPTNTPIPVNTPTDVFSPPTMTEAPAAAVPDAQPTTEAFPTLPPSEPAAAAQIPTEVLDPFAMTGTAYVQGATETVEAYLTGTAQALGIGVPLTPTPTPVGQLNTQAGPTIPLGDCVHEVRAEDRNLYRISLHYGLLVRDIANANGISNVDFISLGQRLIIPGCGTTGAIPPPTSSPTFVPPTSTPYGIAAPTVAGVQTPTPFGTPYAPLTTGRFTHTVQQGETLFEISLRYDVPVQDIANANGITDVDDIDMDQELIIP